MFARMQARNADSSFVEGGVAEGFSLPSHLMLTNVKKKNKTLNLSLLYFRMNSLVVSWNVYLKFVLFHLGFGKWDVIFICRVILGVF